MKTITASFDIEVITQADVSIAVAGIKNKKTKGDDDISTAFVIE